MGNYEELKQAISDVIKTNGNQEITGAIMQNALLSIISTVGSNATFAGIATPETNPGTPDQNVFYIALKNGIYSNFGSIELNNEVLLLTNKNGSWEKTNTGIATLVSVDSIKAVQDYKNDSYNKIDDAALTAERAISSSGNISNISGQSVSDYVYCKGANFVYGTFNESYYINFYNSDLEIISTIKGKKNAEISIPQNASFFRGTFANNQPKQAYIDIDETQFYEFGKTETDLEIEKINGRIDDFENEYATKTDVDESILVLKDEYFIQNKIKGFEQQDSWVITNNQPFPSVVDGVADWGSSTARLYQRAEYIKGKNVLVHVEINATYNYVGAISVIAYFRNSGGFTVRMYSMNPTKDEYQENKWVSFTKYIDNNDIAENVTFVELYIARAAGTLLAKNPIILISENNNLNSNDADSAKKAAIANRIIGIDNDYISILNRNVENILSNGDFSNGFVGYNFVGLKASLVDDSNDIKLVSINQLSHCIITTKKFETTIHDRYYLYMDIEVADVTTLDKTISIDASMSVSQTRYGSSNKITLGEGRHIFMLKIDPSTVSGGQVALLENETKELSLLIAFTKATSEIPLPATYYLKEFRLFKNLDFSNVDTTNDEYLNIFANIISGNNYASNSINNSSYYSFISNYAQTAKQVDGFAPIFQGKKLNTIGDSITFQRKWQKYVVGQFGLRWSEMEVIQGIGFVNISTMEIYDIGLTYNYDDGFWYDNNNVRYELKVPAGSGAPCKFIKYTDKSKYNLPLTPDKVSYPKYYLDSENNKYLPMLTAYGGMPFRASKDLYSMYEMSFMMKFYKPDVLILTGGTNDPVGTYGTAEDEICELTLEQVSELTEDVTVCSSVKGAIKRVMTDSPTTLIFLAMPVRSGREEDINNGTKESRKNLENQFRKIAEEMGVGFINWNSGIGITDYNLPQCFIDGIHPNDFGGYLMGRGAAHDML